MTIYESAEAETPQLVCAERHGLAHSVLIFDQVEQYNNHVEAAHHQLVPREGETLYEAAARFVTAHPEVQDCPHCRALGAPWVREVH